MNLMDGDRIIYDGRLRGVVVRVVYGRATRTGELLSDVLLDDGGVQCRVMTDRIRPLNVIEHIGEIAVDGMT